MAAPLCTKCWYRALRTGGTQRLSIARERTARPQWQWPSRRAMASMSPESQHKVRFSASTTM